MPLTAQMRGRGTGTCLGQSCESRLFQHQSPFLGPYVLPEKQLTLTAAQIDEGVKVASIIKPQAGTRLGITLTSRSRLHSSCSDASPGAVYISKLAPDALGAMSGHLEVGDAVLAVNGAAVDSHHEASAVIKAAMGSVHLTIKKAPGLYSV